MLKNKKYVYTESIKVPSHLNYAQDMFDRMLEHKDIVALINSDTDEQLTYRELAQKTVDIALSLTRMGVKKGEVVSVCSEKRVEMICTILGIICTGATFSPSDITSGSFSLTHKTKMSKPRIMFCSPSGYDLHKETLDSVGCIEKYIVYGDEVKPDTTLFKDFLTETADVADFCAVPVDGKDLLLIMYSSGTTGLPKGVPLTHLGMMVNSLQLTNDSYNNASVLNTREWYFSYGLMYTLAALKRGCTIVYSPKNTHADCLAAIHKYKVKYLQITPGTVTELIKSTILDDFDLSSVESIVSSSTPIKSDQVEAVKKRIPSLKQVIQFYGSTEGGGGICNELDAPLGPRSGSVGVPIRGVTIKVVDQDTRKPLGPGERGEICIKSPSLTPGYLCTPHRDYMDEEDFFLTGDIGYYDEDNYFYIVNRIKELIKFNDFAVAPAELESLLLNHPAVADVGVVGAPSQQWGEAPMALVVLRSGAAATEQELVEFCNSKVAFRMRLAGGVRFVDHIPKGAGGKMDRNALKKMI